MKQPPGRALVTGATGFIGSHLVEHLWAAGWQVHALARPGASLPAFVRAHSWQGDALEARRAVESSRPDVVFHLASLFLAQHTPEQVAPLIEANVLLGAQLLDAMAALGVRCFVNAGTSWQHFHSEAYRPANLYAATKQAFEDILAFYVDAHGMRAITLALFDSYGPGDTRRKLLRLLMDALRTGETLEMSPGEQQLDLVHVDDVCRAFLQAAALLQMERDEGSARAPVYAVSGGERMSLRALVDVLERATGKQLPVSFGGRPYREREVMQLWDGPALPGWSPRIPLLQGFRDCWVMAEGGKGASSLAEAVRKERL